MSRFTSKPVAFLTAYADQSKDDDALVIPEDLTTLSDEDLTALSDQAAEAFNALYQGGEASLNEDDLTALGAIAEGIETLNAEASNRAEASSARAEQAAALAARVAPVEAEVEDETTDEVEGETTDEVEGETTDEVVEEESLAASGGKKEIRVNLSGIRKRQTKAPVDSTPRTLKDVAFAAANVPGLTQGEGIDFADMAKAIERRMATFNKAQYDAAAKSGRRLRQEFGLAAITKPHGDLMIKTDSQSEIDNVLARAADESRLPQGSLVASGGWCAPSETLYDLYDCGESRDGLLSIPEVGISRGGIRFNRGVSFADVFAGIGFHYTEAQDIAGTYGVDEDGIGDGSAGDKPCFKVDCIDFEEVRLELDGLCISAGLLQARGYPEIIADTLRKALVAHDLKIDANVIGRIVAGSTPVSLPADQVGAAAPVLTAIELQVAHYRSAGRLAANTSLEAVFPQWVNGVIRSDLSRRLGVDLFDVPDSRINKWFSDRGVNAQFVSNWQAVGSTPASGFTAWPTSVQFLLYKAGTWVKGTSDVISIDNVYDSVQLGQNNYTALFTEEGWLVVRRGCDSRVVTVPLCPTGDTGGGVLIDCDGSAGA